MKVTIALTALTITKTALVQLPQDLEHLLRQLLHVLAINQIRDNGVNKFVQERGLIRKKSKGFFFSLSLLPSTLYPCVQKFKCWSEWSVSRLLSHRLLSPLFLPEFCQDRVCPFLFHHYLYSPKSFQYCYCKSYRRSLYTLQVRKYQTAHE